jgi:hypothetical protein
MTSAEGMGISCTGPLMGAVGGLVPRLRYTL